MNKFRLLLLMGCMSLIAANSVFANDYKFTIGAKTWYSIWTIKSEEPAFDGLSSGGQFSRGPMLSLRKDKWRVGINYWIGTFHFKNIIVRENNSGNSNDMDIERAEVDIYGAYQLTPHLSLLMAYKRLSYDYKFSPSSASDTLFNFKWSKISNARLLGLSGFMPIAKGPIFVYGTLAALYARGIKTTTLSNADTFDVNRKDFGFSFDGGFASRIGKTNLAYQLGFKFQLFQQSNSQAERDIVYGLVASLNYTI